MLVIALATMHAACSAEPGDRDAPTDEEIQDLADRVCTQVYTCYEHGSEVEEAVLLEECKAERNGLDEVLSEELNKGCEDVWLVYEFHDCWSSLGCTEYTESNPEVAGSPCYEELMAVYDANCSW